MVSRTEIQLFVWGGGQQGQHERGQEGCETPLKKNIFQKRSCLIWKHKDDLGSIPVTCTSSMTFELF